MNQPSRKHKHSLETLALDIRQNYFIYKNIHLPEERVASCWELMSLSLSSESSSDWTTVLTEEHSHLRLDRA